MYSKYYKYILFMIIIIIFLAGCNEEKVTTSFSIKTNNELQGGSSFGLVDEKALSEKQIVHKLAKGETYTPKLTIINGLRQSDDYKIFFLLDYKQFPVYYKGQEKTQIHLTLPSHSETSFEVEIPRIKEGTHDFVVLVVKQSERHLNKSLYVPPEEIYMKRRVTLIVGNEKQKEPHFKKITDITKIDAIELENIFNPFISLLPEKDMSQALSLIKKKQLNNLWLNIPSESEHSQFAIVVLLNNKQVNLKTPFIQSSSLGVLHVPLDLNYKLDKEILRQNNLVVAVIENPYSIFSDDDEPDFANWEVKLANKITVTK